jgi:SAM-dependent methyltransferase
MNTAQDFLRRTVRKAKRIARDAFNSRPPVPSSRPEIPALQVSEVRSLDEFKCLLESWQSPRLPLPPGGVTQWAVGGHCAVSGSTTNFRMDELYADRSGDSIQYNWRERLVCDCCGLNSRQRASIHLFELMRAERALSKVWITEQVTAVHHALKQCVPVLTGSEFLGDSFQSGFINDAGIRHEDVTSSSFPADSMDAILSFDVFEHVPIPLQAFRECARVLGPHGVLLFTVPFLSLDQNSRVRARIEDGKLLHLMEPQYHGDPVQPDKGVLCFQEFGWDILENLRSTGFADASVLIYESAELGYLGGPQILIKAIKSVSMNDSQRNPQSGIPVPKASIRYSTLSPFQPPRLERESRLGRDELIAMYWQSHPRFQYLKYMTPNGSKVLDVGCGPGGGLASWLSWTRPDRSDVRIFGLDIEERTQLIGYSGFARCDLNAEELPFAGEDFDAVIVSHVLEHLDAPGSVVAKIASRLKPGGSVYLEIPDPLTTTLPTSELFRQKGWPMMISNFFDDYTHLKTYSASELAEFGTAAGLVLERAGSISGEFLADQMIDFALRNNDQEVMLYGYWLATRWAHFATLRKPLAED